MENLTHDLVEFFNSAHRKSADLNMWVQTGSKENLIRVDVSDAGNDLLMHQKRLQPTASLSQNAHKIRLRHEKWVNPESASEISLKLRLVQQRKTSEPTRVPVA